MLGVLSITLLYLAGCSRESVEQTPVHGAKPSVNTRQAPNAKTPANSSDSTVAMNPESIPLGMEKVKVKAGDGTLRYSFKPKDDGAKLVDAGDREIARFNLSDRKLKFKNASDDVLGYVMMGAGKFKLEDAQQERTLWKMQRQSDGDWKLEDGSGRLVYKVMRRDYGYEIESDSNESIAKLKVKGEKISLRNDRDETVWYTKDTIHPLAFCCFGFKALEDPASRAAFAVAIQAELGGMPE